MNNLDSFFIAKKDVTLFLISKLYAVNYGKISH